MKNPFAGLYSFADAATLWQLNDSTLRKAVTDGRLVAGKDVQKFGKQWVITEAAMLRLYGPKKQPEQYT